MTTDGATLDDARRTLYSGARATFLERRKELAGAARGRGERDEAKSIGAMRKPSAAAHVVNLLARADDSSLRELLELGATIRGAMAAGDDDEIRALLRGRAGAIANTVAKARTIAGAIGESASGAVVEQIAQTLRAAMGSDDAAAAVREGTLTDALDEPGFGGFSMEPSGRPPPRKDSGAGQPQPKAVDDHDVVVDQAAERAEKAAQRAAEQARIKSATAEVARAEKALAAATKRRDGLQRHRDRLVSELAKIDGELAPAQQAVDDIESQLSAASAELEASNGSSPG